MISQIQQTSLVKSMFLRVASLFDLHIHNDTVP